MENATKALIMAGSILLAMLIIGAAVMTFRSITQTQREQEESVRIKQINDFNKGYTSFEKNLYGSEVLSLANKMTDYNEKVEQKISGYVGYSKMELSVQVGTQKKGLTELDKIYHDVEAIKEKFGDQAMQQYISKNESGKESEIPAEAKPYLATYASYVEFKRKMFSHVNTEFDATNGRIKSMKYKEITN